MCGGGTDVKVIPSCMPENDVDFCSRYHKNCGTYAAQDNCGQPRTVKSCGVCADGTACSAINICSKDGCTPPTDAELCTQKGWNCGTALSTFDSCGNRRDGITCGNGTNCGAGQGCDANTHKCTTGVCVITIADFCKAQGNATCGTITAVDACGATRTESCGSCNTIQNCNGAHQCVDCESDQAFCDRLKLKCGPYDGTKDCGLDGSVDCGSCTTGTCQSNQCVSVCTRETDTQFCDRLVKNCATVTAPDNCGNSYTVDCGVIKGPCPTSGAGGRHCGSGPGRGGGGLCGWGDANGDEAECAAGLGGAGGSAWDDCGVWGEYYSNWVVTLRWIACQSCDLCSSFSGNRNGSRAGGHNHDIQPAGLSWDVSERARQGTREGSRLGPPARKDTTWLRDRGPLGCVLEGVEGASGGLRNISRPVDSERFWGWPRSRTGGVLATRFKGDERSARGVVRVSAARGPTRAWGAAAPERLWNGLNAPGPRSTRVGTRGCPPQVLRPAGQERRDSGVGLEGPAGDLSLLVLCQSVAWPVDPDGQSAIKELVEQSDGQLRMPEVVGPGLDLHVVPRFVRRTVYCKHHGLLVPARGAPRATGRAGR